MFYKTIKSLRLEKRLTLRDFCEKVGLNSSNWSKVERGVNPPPVDVLERVAKFFGLTGAKKLAFMDEALQCQEIPVADNEILQRALPAFPRELTEAELKNLAGDIRKLH